MNLDAIKSQLADYLRPAYTPVTSDGDVGPERSKFAGVAWINAGEAWPSCGFCKKPLQLFLQLNLSQLPSPIPELPTHGFLQVFYCTTPDSYCDQLGDEPFSPFGKYLCARVLEQGPACQFTDSSPVENALPVKTITGWQKKEDYPAPTELEDVAPGAVTEEEADYLFDVIEQSDYGNSEVEPTTIRGDKLGGWPMWLQHVGYPTCPDCSATMEYLLQIGSNQNLDYMFGDCGIAQLHRCPNHQHRFAFSWAGS